jgi:hypothetical protein
LRKQMLQIRPTSIEFFLEFVADSPVFPGSSGFLGSFGSTYLGEGQVGN